MNAKKLMTVDEVKEFFSQTHEYQVNQKGDNLVITYTKKGKSTSLIVWIKAVTIQELIRTVEILVWNHCNNIMD